MSHRKWRETKQQPRRAMSGNQISCCLVSIPFPCGILSSPCTAGSNDNDNLSLGAQTQFKHANCELKLLNSSEMATRKLLFLAVIYATVVTASATCGTDGPIQPPPGTSESVTITFSDPNLGLVERSFWIHIPAGKHVILTQTGRYF